MEAEELTGSDKKNFWNISKENIFRAQTVDARHNTANLELGW